MLRANFPLVPELKIFQSVVISDNFDRHATCPSGTFPSEQGPFSHYSPKTGYDCRMPKNGCEYILIYPFDTCVEIPEIKPSNHCVAYLNNYKPYATVDMRSNLKCVLG